MGVTPSQFFNESSNVPILVQKIIEELEQLDDDDLMFILSCIQRIKHKD